MATEIHPHCPEHRPHSPGYIDFFAWCKEQAKAGLKQKQCPKCQYWFWPSELSGLRRTEPDSQRKKDYVTGEDSDG